MARIHDRREPPGTIDYTYQGEGWYEATLPLAFAYHMTTDTRYSNKLIELAQEMIRAQSDPDNTEPSPAGTTIKSAHITELRSALDAALTRLGLAATAGGYTNSPLTGAQVKPIDFQELRNRVQ